MSKIRLEKYTVCRSCLSIRIFDVDCVCVYSRNYETIELEFEVCTCCNRALDNQPAVSLFNEQQFKKEESDKNS